MYQYGPMQTKVVKLNAVQPDLARVEEAARVVEAGGLAAFPTETVYGVAARVATDSLARLSKVKGRASEKPYSLHVGNKDDVQMYVPAVGVRARKLIDVLWPGPLTIVFELNGDEVENRRQELEKEVFEGLYRDNCIGIRCPDNAVASMLLREARCAVVAPSANLAGEAPAVNGQEVLAQLSGRIELLLDGGPCRYKESSTVVKVGKQGLEILRPGVYSQAELEAVSRISFLFVCTGNTCRSAMAEGMFRKYLAEKLGCRVDQLKQAGYKMVSAGVVAVEGFPASAGAVAACAAKGVDIRAHTSRALSEELVKDSDFIFGMCEMHCERVVALSGEAAGKCVLMAEGKDIPDPIGQPQDVYNSCADLIEEAVRKRIGELSI